jgi:hypothetical protein
MGLRGLWARPHKDPPPFTITAESIRLYRFMRQLERNCNCPADEECEHWIEWWETNRKLAESLGLLTWELSFADPAWEWPRTRQSEIDRFHLLEAAASKAKKHKYRYKWER